MTIVLDANVLISGLLNPNGTPASILNLVLNKKIKLNLDARILSEYTNVLRRPKFGFNDELINPLIDFLKMESEMISPEPQKLELDDPEDAMFVEVLSSGSAHYLVSGNIRHFPDNPSIVTPSEFMEIYLNP